MPSPSSEAKPVFSSLKDQLILLGSLVTFVGIVSTEAYYRRFGLRYQFMSLPATHILYRGLTAILFRPYVIIPYALGSVAFALDEQARTSTWGKLSGLRHFIAHAFVFCLVALTYPIAHHVGAVEAERDLTLETSQLPRLIHLRTESQEFTSSANLRVLFAGSDQLVVFKPYPANDAQVSDPHMRILLKSDIHDLQTSH